MNLSCLTDRELDHGALNAAAGERSALHLVLEHLAEVQRRKSFSPRYRTIHAYAVGELKYDDKSAWRRVNAMFLMRELPQIKSSIRNGDLDLTKLALVQNHIRTENEISKKSLEPSLFGLELPKPKLTKQEKLEVVQSVIGKTSRESLRTLAAQSSAPQKLKKPDQVSAVAYNANEVRLMLSDADLVLISELRDLWAHKMPNASISEVVSAALIEAKKSIHKYRLGKARGGADNAASFETENKRTPTPKLKRRIFERANGKCEICRSTRAIEYDHRKPWSKGGETSFENLRLLCRSCNQREALRTFGLRQPNQSRDSYRS